MCWDYDYESAYSLSLAHWLSRGHYILCNFDLGIHNEHKTDWNFCARKNKFNLSICVNEPALPSGLLGEPKMSCWYLSAREEL